MSVADIENELSALGMSDEEYMKMDHSKFTDEPAVEVEQPVVEEVEQEVPVVAVEEEEQEEVETPAAEDEAKPESDAAAEEAEEAEQDPEKPVVTDPVVPAVEAEKPVVDKDKPAEEAEPDYKAMHDQLFAPFKANGKEMRINSVDDAVALMQMGANYNKKMAALKPNLKLMKVLENNDLLTEDKIGFLIDLAKKDPAAIGKLIKDSGIDPLDVDEAKEYKPKAYTVDDREIELDQVLDDIQDTPTYNKTIGLVSNKWDAPSKQVVADSPQLLKVINDHMASGVYDLISAEVERERMFGRLKGISDIAAYQQVGDALDARGGFNHLFTKPVTPTPAGQVVAPLVKPSVQTPSQVEKKRAASSPKAAAPVAAKPDYNPLAMSDEEYSKQFNEKFL